MISALDAPNADVIRQDLNESRGALRDRAWPNFRL
jgi:hypothetical protein